MKYPLKTHIKPEEFDGVYMQSPSGEVVNVGNVKDLDPDELELKGWKLINPRSPDGENIDDIEIDDDSDRIAEDYMNDQMLQKIDEIDENLHKWFKEKWVRFGPDGKIRGACARGKSSEGKPKCRPLASARAMGKKGRAKAARRKRREDPNPDRRGKANNVKTK